MEKKIDSSLNYSVNMKAHRAHKTCWKTASDEGPLIAPLS